jgi:hypothetical protein
MNRISLCLFMAINFVYFLCHLGWGRVWTWVYDPPMIFTILSGRWVDNTGCPAKSSTKGGHPIWKTSFISFFLCSPSIVFYFFLPFLFLPLYTVPLFSSSGNSLGASWVDSRHVSKQKVSWLHNSRRKVTNTEKQGRLRCACLHGQPSLCWRHQVRMCVGRDWDRIW